MRVLVTGAYGFIGQHVANGLLDDSHEVIACGRNLDLGRRFVPRAQWLRCDFNEDVRPEIWAPRLRGVDAIVNCVGILQQTAVDSHERVHSQAPIALFTAAQTLGIRRVIQISAVGAEPDIETTYSQSKARADTFLRGLDLDWIILKPSLIYARGSYGGTTLIRALAGLPFLTPLIDGGRHMFQPVAMEDLVAVVVRLIAPDAPGHQELSISGPEPKSLADIVRAIRRWLGFPDVPIVSIPVVLARVGLLFGDVAGWLGLPTSLRSSALRQMEIGNVADPSDFIAATGVSPRPMAEALARDPATLQDRIHARSAIAVTLLRVSLGLFWIATGVITLLPKGIETAASFLAVTGLSEASARLLVVAGALADIGLGLPFIVGWKIRAVGSLQISLTLIYLAILSVYLPLLWLDPFGPLIKTIPIMFATLIAMAFAELR